MDLHLLRTSCDLLCTLYEMKKDGCTWKKIPWHTIDGYLGLGRSYGGSLRWRRGSSWRGLRGRARVSSGYGADGNLLELRERDDERRDLRLHLMQEAQAFLHRRALLALHPAQLLQRQFLQRGRHRARRSTGPGGGRQARQRQQEQRTLRHLGGLRQARRCQVLDRDPSGRAGGGARGTGRSGPRTCLGLRRIACKCIRQRMFRRASFACQKQAPPTQFVRTRHGEAYQTAH